MHSYEPSPKDIKEIQNADIFIYNGGHSDAWVDEMLKSLDIIYGMGEAYDGKLRKADLQRDTPYNTYTRQGLPPSPIAMPSEAALAAAASPAESKALYFVARNDGTGSSEFSETLQAHNRAVQRFILKK